MSNQTTVVKPLPASRHPSGEPPYAPAKWNNGKAEIKATHNCYTYMLNDLYTVPRKNGKPQPGFFLKHMKNLKFSQNQNKRLSCPSVQKGVSLDNPHIKVMSLKTGGSYVCPRNYYKGFMVVSPGMDYHFARQDNRMLKVYRKMYSDNTQINQNNSEACASVFVDYAISMIPEIVSLAHEVYPKCMHFESSARSKLWAIARCSQTWSHKPGATDATDKDADGRLITNPEMANWNYSKKGGINYKHKCCYFSIPRNSIAHTYSTGIPNIMGNSSTNNPSNIRTNIDVNSSIDHRYEKLMHQACAKTSSQRRRRSTMRQLLKPS